MSVLVKLTPAQKQNASILIQRCIVKGITNHYSQGAILSIALKEANLNFAAKEISYGKTPNERIRTIFSKTKYLSDAILNSLKINTKAFFDFVYNGIIGNGPGDGYRFRGRGYNQLTGRANYRANGLKIGYDLESNPDLLSTNAVVAADSLIHYFISSFEVAKKLKATIIVNDKEVKVPVLSLYHTTGINDFKNTTDSVGAFYHANAGWGKTIAAIKADPTGGLAKAKSTVDDFYTIVSKGISENKTATGGGLFFLIALGVAIANRKKIAAWIDKQKTKN
jgi:predicted chitinase